MRGLKGLPDLNRRSRVRFWDGKAAVGISSARNIRLSRYGSGVGRAPPAVPALSACGIAGLAGRLFEIVENDGVYP